MKLLKWLGIVLVVVIGLVIVLAGGLYAFGMSKRSSPRAVEVDVVPVPDDSASIAEGRRLSMMYGCRECHGLQLEGKVLVDDPLLGRLIAPHIAPGQGSVTADYSMEDWVRAIRHGIARDGRAMIIMPSSAYHGVAREDLGNLLAYVTREEPTDHVVEEKTQLRLAMVLLGAGVFPFESNLIEDHKAPARAKPAPADSAEYGEYLSLMCRACHGKDLLGTSDGPNSTPPLARGSVFDTYDEAAFGRMLDTGATPNGRTLDPEAMPWKAFSVMNADERHALWAYLKTVSPPVAH